MTDIVERLRLDAEPTEGDMEEAATEIERLREALEEVRLLVLGANHSEVRYPKARAALKEDK